MIQKDFNVEAMEKKIKNNLESGNFKDIPALKISLRQELIENRRSALQFEHRATELQDQIEYMDEKYKEGQCDLKS